MESKYIEHREKAGESIQSSQLQLNCFQNGRLGLGGKTSFPSKFQERLSSLANPALCLLSWLRLRPHHLICSGISPVCVESCCRVVLPTQQMSAKSKMLSLSVHPEYSTTVQTTRELYVFICKNRSGKATRDRKRLDVSSLYVATRLIQDQKKRAECVGHSFRIQNRGVYVRFHWKEQQPVSK